MSTARSGRCVVVTSLVNRPSLHASPGVRMRSSRRFAAWMGFAWALASCSTWGPTTIGGVSTGSGSGPGSGGNPGGSSFSGPSCPNGLPTASMTSASSAACDSCVESECSDQLSSTESACSAYFDCYCACAEGDDSCYSSCAPEMTNNSACSASLSTILSCDMDECESQCSGGGTAPNDAGTAPTTTPTGTCATLLECCTMATGSASSCAAEVAAFDDNQTTCAGGLSAYADAGPSCQ